MSTVDTIALHGGYNPGNGEPRQVPIYQSTTWKYSTSEDMGKLFDLEASGYFYTRLQNPTNDYVASKLCAMEGGFAGMLTCSGQAANFFAVFNICEAGDHFIASANIYGGTYNLFGVTFKKMGIECTFVDQTLPLEELQKYIRPNTKCIFGETITNPTVDILDIEKFAALAHNNGIPLIMDNTFATPVNCRPIEFGCDIVTHSTTKYIDGHGSSVGGAIIDSYHGLTYATKFGKAAYITKATAQLMRDFGSIQSPQNAYYIQIGLESLPVRMARHCANAQKVAEFLASDDRIAWVKYPGLKTDSQHELAQKYCPKGTCGVMCFGVKGGREASIKFMDSLEFATIATHVADCKTLLLHPASHTHRQLTDEQLAEAGIPGDLIRFSVGMEDPDDIIADLKQALDKIG